MARHQRSKGKEVLAGTKKKVIQVGARCFSSLTEASECFGLSIQKVSRRLKSGWTVAQAFELEAAPQRKPTTNRKVEVQGRVFESIKSAAEACNVDVDTVRGRLGLGWPLVEALGLKKRVVEREPRATDKSVYCGGTFYPSVSKLASEYKLPYRLVAKRLRSGWSPEQAVDLESHPPRYRNPDGSQREHSWAKPVKLDDGRVYADSKFGSYLLYCIKNTLNNKMYIGITTTSLQTRFYHHKSTASSGGGYNSKLYNAMRKLGIEHFYIALLRNDATSIEDLLAQETAAIEEFDTVERGYNASLGGTIGLVSPIIVDGKQYMSRGQAAAFYGIDAYNFNQRISKLGWTPDEAAELVDRPKFGRRNRIWSVDYKGERLEFSSQTKAAEHFGIKRGTVHMRISKGWSLAQALGIQPPPKKEKE